MRYELLKIVFIFGIIFIMLWMSYLILGTGIKQLEEINKRWEKAYNEVLNNETNSL